MMFAVLLSVVTVLYHDARKKRDSDVGIIIIVYFDTNTNLERSSKCPVAIISRSVNRIYFRGF